MSGFLVGSPLIDPAVKSHNGGTSSLTLDNSGTTSSTLLFINGVSQTAGTDFNVSGTTLTTTTAIAAGTNIATTVQLAVTGTVNVPADNSVTGGKLDVSLVAGDVIYGSGTDTLARLAKGSDGEVLKLASGVPSWATDAGGAWNFIETEVASNSATLNFTSSIDSTYDMYAIICSVLIPATDDTQLYLRISDDGGSSYESSNYLTFFADPNSSGTSHSGLVGSTSAMTITKTLDNSS